MMKHVLLALVGLCFSTAASAQDIARDGEALETCDAPVRGVILLMSVHASPSVAAGETVRIRPIWTTYPGHETEVALSCFADLRLSADAPAVLTDDATQLEIAADAVAGDTFTLSASYAGREIDMAFRIVERVVSPLVGTWYPVPGSCAEGTAIYGLNFANDGTFAVETVLYPHYNPTARGNWRAEGDRLILSDYLAGDGSGGTATDFEPEALFTLEDGILRFDRPWHGSVESYGTCNAPLQRRG